MQNQEYEEFIYDISKEYDVYYQGGERSIYNRRFGKERVILHEKYIIKKSINKVIKNIFKDKNKSQYCIEILDFGCGDGRLFEFLESISIKLKNIQFRITALDISLVGLKEYVKKLQYYGYDLSYVNENYDNTPYLYASMSCHNIHIDFVYSNFETKIEDIEILKYKKFHLNLCMFSVLSHVDNKQKRIEILNSFNQVSAKNALSIITIPGKKMFSKEYKIYKFLRSLLDQSRDLALVNDKIEILRNFLQPIKDEGDIFYSRNSENKFLINFCHLFSISDFKEELKLANFNKKEIRILSIIYVPILTKKNSFLKLLDFALSKIMHVNIFPSFFIDNIFDQIYCINEHQDFSK